VASCNLISYAPSSSHALSIPLDSIYYDFGFLALFGVSGFGITDGCYGFLVLWVESMWAEGFRMRVRG
jgi:hypothetical protein